VRETMGVDFYSFVKPEAWLVGNQLNDEEGETLWVDFDSVERRHGLLEITISSKRRCHVSEVIIAFWNFVSHRSVDEWLKKKGKKEKERAKEKKRKEKKKKKEKRKKERQRRNDRLIKWDTEFILHKLVTQRCIVMPKFHMLWKKKVKRDKHNPNCTNETTTIKKKKRKNHNKLTVRYWI
jgi:hypothetical protein